MINYYFRIEKLEMSILIFSPCFSTVLINYPVIALMKLDAQIPCFDTSIFKGMACKILICDLLSLETPLV